MPTTFAAAVRTTTTTTARAIGGGGSRPSFSSSSSSRRHQHHHHHHSHYFSSSPSSVSAAALSSSSSSSSSPSYPSSFSSFSSSSSTTSSSHARTTTVIIGKQQQQQHQQHRLFSSCPSSSLLLSRGSPSSSPSSSAATAAFLLGGSGRRMMILAARSFATHEPSSSLHVEKEKGQRPIYLDVQATSPVDPRVLDATLPFYLQQFGNPHSRTHQYGWESEQAVEDARKHVADLVGADPKEIVFTSGATESNNTSIKGVAHFYKAKKNHIITTQTEHKCVLDSCRVLQDEGFQVTYLPVQTNGVLDLKVLEAAIRPETCLVSVMAVNNEIGVIQPLAEIGKLCRERKIFFHTDAAQAVGKIPVDVNAMNIDLMSISGHKIYGPKGVGALYVRRRPRVRLEPILSGGGQERGLRSGTVPTPLAVGIGEACRIAKNEMAYDHARIKKLADRLYTGITSKVDHVVRNGDPDAWYPGCLNLSFAYVEGESLLMALKEIALSSGSACTSASLEPSYVLRALGADDETAHSSIRFGIGRFTTEAEIDFVVDRVVRHVGRLREMSPLWEMVQEGIDLKSIKWTEH